MPEKPLLPRTFPEAAAAWKGWAARPAILRPGVETSVTYGDLFAQVERLARRLQGVLAAQPPASPVALAMPNGLEFVVAFLALARSGRAAMPLNPALTAELAASQLQGGGAGMLLTAGRAPELILGAAARMGLPIRQIRVEGADVVLDGPEAPSAPVLPVTPDNVLLLLQTSGTTGKPKWVPLTQRNILASVEHIIATYMLTPEDSSLLVMPLFHVHGLVGVALATLFSGGALVTPPKFSASHFPAWMEAFRPTWYSAVPTIHQILLEGPAWSDEAVRALRFVRSCSSPLMPRTATDLERRLQVPVLQAYGMTEAAHQIASQPLPPVERVAGSVGQPTGLEVAIFDEHGRALSAGNTGEVVLRGENIMAGYLGNPEANARSFTRGWFRTGDLGQLDAQGRLTLVGRSKEMINRGGEKIAPAQVDAVLLEAPGVTQAVAFGMPDAIYGEVVHAAVTGSGSLDADELIRFCRERLPAFMAPVAVHVVPAIPTGPTGKMQRGQLPQLLGLP